MLSLFHFFKGCRRDYYVLADSELNSLSALQCGTTPSGRESVQGGGRLLHKMEG